MSENRNTDRPMRVGGAAMGGPAWTRGPWAVNGSHVYASDGAILATVSNPGSRSTDYPLVANRDLIAAAPDLAAALAECVIQIEYLHEKFSETGSGNAVLARARAALAKAKGETT
jgi:hypothetical protein